MSKPRLAFVYHPRSFGTMDLSEAARDLCDLVWVVDETIPEVSSMARLLRRLGSVANVTGLEPDAAAAAIGEHQPDGILGLSDAMLETTAEYAARLDLPFHSIDTARRLVDKHLQREAFLEAGLPTPGHWNVPAPDESERWQRLLAELTFPVVLKPRWGEGSRDTFLLSSLDELRTKLALIEGPPERELVIEEYLRDDPDHNRGPFAGYVSVESVVAGGRVSHVAVTGRFPLAEPLRETGFFIPSALSEEDGVAVRAVAADAARAVGVELGCLHTEVKLTPDGPRVIEVNGRIGGGVPEMLSLAAGVELMPIAFRLALGEQVAFESMPAVSSIGYLFYVQAPADYHNILAVDGLDELGAQPGVHAVTMNRGPGQPIDSREGNHGHVFSVLGTAQDHDALAAMDRYIAETVSIIGN
ncbi:MAG: hypothetical protein ACRDPI_03300 [Nocardioidaceae bacterium]